MSTTNIHLLPFKIESHLQKTRTLNYSGTSELIPKKNRRKIFNITFANLPFAQKYLNAILSTLESTSLKETIRCA